MPFLYRDPRRVATQGLEGFSLSLISIAVQGFIAEVEDELRGGKGRGKGRGKSSVVRDLSRPDRQTDKQDAALIQKVLDHYEYLSELRTKDVKKPQGASEPKANTSVVAPAVVATPALPDAPPGLMPVQQAQIASSVDAHNAQALSLILALAEAM